MDVHHAYCTCRHFSLDVNGDPVRVSVCHCLACQRRTGSAFGVQARYPRSQVKIAGTSNSYTRIGDSGQALHFHFCPHCGTTLYWELADLPDVIAIALGAFSDPTFLTPQVSVYNSRQHAWIELSANLRNEN